MAPDPLPVAVAEEIAIQGSATIIIFGPDCWAITSAGSGAIAAPAPRPAVGGGSPPAAGIFISSSVEAA